jgi:MFS family permease
MREMFRFLRDLKGNAKAAVLAQPLWGVPFNLFMPFAALYMSRMGVTDIQIGIMLAVGRFSQMGMAFFGGVITDKFGRRLTTLFGDIVAWSIPALIWAFAQNFTWFLIAAIVNSVVQITGVAWECLWIDEDGENSTKITQIFNWLHVCGVISVFFVPVAGLLVWRFSLIPVVRGLYIFAFISMTAKAILLYMYSKETKRGIERINETKNVSFVQMFSGYGGVLTDIVRSAKMLHALGLQSVQAITLMISSTFFSLYTTQNLGLDDSFLAYFPILRAVVMLLFLFFIQNKLNMFNPRNVMLCGITAYLAANGLLLISRPDNWLWIAGYTLLEACAVALFMPRMSALIANAIEPRERARIRSLFNVIMLAVVSPFAYLAGYLSETDRRLPFVLNIGLFVVMAGFTYKKTASRRLI